MTAGWRMRRLYVAAWPQLVIAAMVGAFAIVGRGGPMRVLYLVMAVAIGRYLERRDAARYVRFLICIWFATPLVRRIADLQAGWQDPSIVLLTPYLVTALAVPPLLSGFLRRSDRIKSLVPGAGIFAIACLGVAVGVPVGLLARPSTGALETLNWLLPPVFGWYIATRADDVHRIEATVSTTFVTAAFVAGVYALYQFGSPPLWDINWMQRSEMTTIGRPEPFAVRVFGPMHSPGIFSAFLMIALVLWLGRPRPGGMVAAGVAGVALLLSQVRSAWLGLAIAALFVFAAAGARERARMAVLAIVAVMLAGPFLFTQEMSELVNDRVATIERLEEDESAQARLVGHGLALEFVAEHPLGAGIGQTDAKMEEYISMRDSVVAASLVQFGLAGTFAYFVGLAGLLWLLWTYYRSAASVQGAALAAAGLGLLATSWLSVVTAGPIGVCLWMIAGLALGDREMRRRIEMAPAPKPRPWRTWMTDFDPAAV